MKNKNTITISNHNLVAGEFLEFYKKRPWLKRLLRWIYRRVIHWKPLIAKDDPIYRVKSVTDTTITYENNP